MVCSIVLHLVAGVVAGSIFSVRTLIFLLGLLLLEAAALTVAYGWRLGVGPAIGIVALQCGYLAGLYGRSVFERVGGPLREGRAGRRLGSDKAGLGRN
jgi:hypothetical protein